MNTNIVIVGGGASCISFIYSFIKNKIYEKYDNPIITVVEKLKDFGPGNAYMKDLKSNILNTKAEFITAISDKPGHFYEWLTLNKDVWSKDYPSLTIDKSTYAPRSLFGLYMRDTFSDVCIAAESVGVPVVRISAEATDVKRVTDDRPMSVYLSDGRCLPADKVVLACGTQSRTALYPPYSNSIISSPYPTSKLDQEVSDNDDVAIVGSRLSAIDAVITLMESGHKGKITILSRSGYFPYVRGSQGRYKNKFLNRDYIAENYETLTLMDLMSLYKMEEFTYLSENPFVNSELLPVDSGVIRNIESFLEGEIRKSSYSRAWQAILYDTNSSVEFIWDKLVDSDKERFFTEFYAKAMSLRVSIPKENAEKILSYIKSGRVDFVAGKQSINTNNGKVRVHSETFRRDFDKVIYAVGSPRNISETDSFLLKNIVSSGLVREHSYGGLDVSVDSYGVVSRNGVVSHDIFAVGEITSGKFLFTSAMDIIVRHASKCACNLDGHHSKSSRRVTGQY